MPVSTVRRFMSVALLVGAGVCAGCSSSAATPSPTSNPSLITEAELPTSGTESASDAIMRLRPDFLLVRPAQSYHVQPDAGASAPAPAPALIVNGQRAGELPDLRQVTATSIKSVHYYNIEQAKRKFGTQYARGIRSAAPSRSSTSSSRRAYAGPRRRRARS